MKKSFAKLKKFNEIVLHENFSKNLYLEIDKTPKEKLKYFPKVIKFLSKNAGKWIEINTNNPRIWIDVKESFSILADEDWFYEIEK